MSNAQTATDFSSKIKDLEEENELLSDTIPTIIKPSSKILTSIINLRFTDIYFLYKKIIIYYLYLKMFF